MFKDAPRRELRAKEPGGCQTLCNRHARPVKVSVEARTKQGHAPRESGFPSCWCSHLAPADLTRLAARFTSLQKNACRRRRGRQLGCGHSYAIFSAARARKIGANLLNVQCDNRFFRTRTPYWVLLLSELRKTCTSRLSTAGRPRP